MASTERPSLLSPGESFMVSIELRGLLYDRGGEARPAPAGKYWAVAIGEYYTPELLPRTHLHIVEASVSFDLVASGS